MSKERYLEEALAILVDLGLPKQQQNERSALCLLALLNITPLKNWNEAEAPLMGITPIMDWLKTHYQREYAPNTRETIRRQSVHQFVQARIVIHNPDEPSRAINSPATVYQIEPILLEILKTYGTEHYSRKLQEYFLKWPSLNDQYAKEREMRMVPVKMKNGQSINLSPGSHSELIKKILEDFCSRHVPNGELIYVGDTGGKKYGYFDEKLLIKLGVKLDNHGKIPDVVIYYPEKNWLLLIESVTSHGPVDSKRHHELEKLFVQCTAGLVYISAFPNRKIFLKYVESIAWETDVWVADAPSHLIHFNGTRFLGPYNN